MCVRYFAGLLFAFCTTALAKPVLDIQKAIDALPEGGGTVKIPAGEHVLSRSIQLRSNVTLQGAGPDTVLRKNKQIFGKLTAAASKGSRSVLVENAEQFAVGGQVMIQQYLCCGWDVAQAIVESAAEGELRLDRPLGRNFDPKKGAFAINWFPAITARDKSKIVLRDLTIDGRPDENPGPPEEHVKTYWPRGKDTIPGFTLAGIHLVGCTETCVEGCRIVGWPSDGLSMQGGKGNSVTRCVAENCLRKGFHPGGGLQDSVFSHNVSRGNGDDGLYFCAKVQRVTVTENELIGNKHNGVGGLGDYGDTFNTVAKNVISGNGMHGVQMCNGESNTVVDNAISNNSQSASGEYSGIWLAGTSKSTVQRNRCFDDQAKKTQKCGIEELANCRENQIADNQCEGNAKTQIVLAADQPAPPPEAAPRRGRAAAGPPNAEKPAVAPDAPTGRRRSAAPTTPEPTEPPPRRRGSAAPTPTEQPRPTAAEPPRATTPMNVGAPEIVDFTDPTYGSKIRRLKKDDGHEHNFYYYRDPWNADGSRMLGVQSDLQQKDWHVVLYDGDGHFLKDLFPISQYEWRLCWDRKSPEFLYTWKGSDLFRLNVETGKAESIKSFKPLAIERNGPSINQDGSRILITTSDKVFHSFRLPDLTDERTFKPEVPTGCNVGWDKPHFSGYRNTIDVAYSAPQLAKQGILLYDDTGKVVHHFQGFGGGGHYSFSCNGRLAYFLMPNYPRSDGKNSLDIHVVAVDGSNDRVVFSVPREQAQYLQNMHVSWPAKVDGWFVASFYAFENYKPKEYAPLLDEILQVRLDGTSKYLARTGSQYSRGAGRGSTTDMFWAMPLAVPSADGSRISFNSNRSGTIDQYILYVGSPGK